MPAWTLIQYKPTVLPVVLSTLCVWGCVYTSPEISECNARKRLGMGISVEVGSGSVN